MPYTVRAENTTIAALVSGAKVAEPLLNELTESQAKFDRAVTDMPDSELKGWVDSIAGSPTLTRTQMLGMLYGYLKAGADA